MAISVEEKIAGSVSAILKSVECAICLELLKNPVSTGCGHFFCRFCITETLQSEYQKPCPLCKKPFTRRSIQEAIQRQEVINAAKKLGEICGKAIGVNFFPKENTQKGKNLSDLKENITGPELQIVLKDVAKSKKRKSDEILLNGEPDESENLIPLQKLQNAIKEGNSSADEAIPPTTKRHCQAVSDDDDDSNELPSLENIFRAARLQASLSSENKDKSDVEDMPLLNAVMETDKKSEEKRLIIRRKTKKNIPRKKNNVILKNRKSVLTLKNKTNLANDLEKGRKEVTNEKISEEMEIFENHDICKENKKEFGSRPNKYKQKKVLPNSKKMSQKSELHLSNSSAEEDLITKISEAENHKLVVEKNKNHHDEESSFQECHELTEIEIPNGKTLQSQETNIDALQKNSKSDEISHTVVSIHTFASPQMSKGNSISKSPGWSKVKEVRKDFKVKKFSKLPVQRNTSVCVVDAEYNLEEKSGKNHDKQPKCNAISETVRVAEDLNHSSSRVKVMLDSNEDILKNAEISGVNYKIQNVNVAGKTVIENKTMLEVPDTIEEHEIEDNANQWIPEEISSGDKKENTHILVSETLSNKFAENCNSVDCLLQAADNSIPCIERMKDTVSNEINLQKKTDMIEEPIPMDTGFQVPNNDIYDVDLSPLNDLPDCTEKTKEITYNNNLANLELISKKNDCICKTPVTGLIKENRISKISKITRGSKSPLSDLQKDVLYVEHSQQTSQRIGFYDTKNHNKSFVPAALPTEVPHHTETITSTAILPCHNSVVPWFCNKENTTSEKTKVVKRTCLTLEEIQDYFTKSTFSGKSETICSLPFLSDCYKLHICVADDTLNVSVLKAVDSDASEMHYTKTNLINFPRTSNLCQKNNSVLISEKSIQTSNYKSESHSPTLLPSSNVESDCSEVDDESEAVKQKSNPFPFLSKFFSDSESTPQLHEVFDTCNVNFVPDTHYVEDISDTSVMKDIEKSNAKLPDVTNSKSISDTSNVTTQSTKIFVLPPSNKISYQLPVQIEKSPINIDTKANAKEALDSNHSEDSTNTVINSKANKKKIRNQNSACVSEKKLEMVDVSSQDSTDKNSGISKNPHPTREITQYHRKKLDSDSSNESDKKVMCDNNDCSIELSDSNHCRTLSHYAELMKECDALSSDPDMAFANELVAPLKNITDKINSTSHESNKNQHKFNADLNELNRSVEVNKTTSRLEHVLNMLPNQKKLFSNSNIKQKASRLSLKKKKNPKFRRIQNNSDSDSDESQTLLDDEIGKTSKLTSPNYQNVSAASIQERSTLHSFLSEDINSSQIVKEIEDIDQEIKSVEEKLKMCGHGNLLPEGNKLVLKDLQVEEYSNHEESEDSDDLFSESIPPTPPETGGNCKDSTFKKPRLSY